MLEEGITAGNRYPFTSPLRYKKTATHSEEEEKMSDCPGNVYCVCLFDILFGIKSSQKLLCDVHHTSGKFTIMIFPYDGKGRIFTF